MKKLLAVAVIAALAVLCLTACSENPHSGSSASPANPPTATEETMHSDAPDVDMTPTASFVMEANGRQFYPTFADSAAAEALFEKLDTGMLEVTLHDYGNFEKTGPLPWALPATDERITTQPGDIVLYQGNQICIYYGENTWEFTRLASIDNVSRDELLAILGDGDVTVRFWLEWSE